MVDRVSDLPLSRRILSLEMSGGHRVSLERREVGQREILVSL